MNRIYLDNVATSFPKAPGVAKAVYDYIEYGTVNLNRTESSLSFSTFDKIYALKENLCSLYNYNAPECICFTRNVTEALNWIIKGLFTKSDHIIVSSNEHNAVMRPLIQQGIPFSRIPSDEYGYNDYSDLENLITPKTKAMIINAAGNVSGAIQNLKRPAEFAKIHNIMLFMDAAQASPFIDINMKELDISGICFTGHKGFLGPQGTGGMILRKELALKIDPLISGGTGSESDKETIPAFLPDRLTPGTENIPGLIGLACSVDYVIKNHEELKQKEKEITTLFLQELSEIKSIELKGAPIDSERSNVISITAKRMDIASISYELLKRSGIETRVGLHCAPYAHRSIKTFPGGTLRFSPGPFTTKEEIETTIKTLKEILND